MASFIQPKTDYLIQQRTVDGDRVTIDGGSAGGYTTLCALTFRDIFKAGASYFGIGNLEGMTGDTSINDVIWIG